jgi:hypothetical protein
MNTQDQRSFNHAHVSRHEVQGNSYNHRVEVSILPWAYALCPNELRKVIDKHQIVLTNCCNMGCVKRKYIEYGKNLLRMHWLLGQ